MSARISRRAFLATGGALVVSFSLAGLARSQGRGAGASAQVAPELPGSLGKAPLLDAWIRIGGNGTVTVFTGKAELGQGIATALLQIVSEQLAVALERITIVTADTERTPDEGYTAGSNSMKDSGTAILHAAAQVREILVEEAAKRWGAPPGRLSVAEGAVVAEDGRRITYGALVADRMLHVAASPHSKLRASAARAVMGKSIARVDIPRKVTGGAAYVHDLRLPGMVHARVVRPPRLGARLEALDTPPVARMPGVLKLVRDGDYVAVIAEREFTAIQAMRALSDTAKWSGGKAVPSPREIHAWLERASAEDTVIHGDAAPRVALPGAIAATYRRGYQIHGAIGPSCAAGLLKDGKLTVWTHSQGVYPLRGAIAEMLRMPVEMVHCIHMEGSGCYGHNGADDVAGDAALLAHALPGRPVRVQWMREDEHAGEPYGPAMLSKARATLDSVGRIASWDYEVWSNTHSTRPGSAGNLAPAGLLAAPFAPEPPRAIPQPEGGGDRNAIPIYNIAQPRVVHHFVAEMPLRVSALRALGAYLNVFAIESFMDELARVAKEDPVAFRLRHLHDPRAREVLGAAAERFGWSAWRRAPRRGRGFGFARYKNLAAFAAVAMEVEVEPETGDVRVGRVVAAIDCGEAVNPDGIANQVEGGIVQSVSWTLFEAVAWEGARITSRDWARYPILRYSHVPRAIDVHVLDRPGMPFLGVGEAVQGPAAGALANAVADATGARVRDIPLDRTRIREALKPR